MDDMKVTNLTVDLLQDQANVGLMKQGTSRALDKPNFTSISINVPISTSGDQPEAQLRHMAVEQAKNALREAIRTLEELPA